jgi:hypothetical protein
MPVCGGWAFLDGVVLSQNKSVRPLALEYFLRANLKAHLLSPTPRSKDKTDHLLLLGGSRLRYWLCPSLKRPYFLGRAS